MEKKTENLGVSFKGPNDQILVACHRPEFGKSIQFEILAVEKNWRGSMDMFGHRFMTQQLNTT